MLVGSLTASKGSVIVEKNPRLDYRVNLNKKDSQRKKWQRITVEDENQCSYFTRQIFYSD